jgi:hypothetical protein
MGSSTKKKKEKKKDFQVSHAISLHQSITNAIPENQTESRQRQGKAGQLHRHKFPRKKYAT